MAASHVNTPMMEQYRRIKVEYPDAILFYRLGDFYEMFFEDALVASKILAIALTSRNRGDPDEVPMCGVPYHSAEGYIAKLLRAGHRVAVCEQLEDARFAKGVVKRDVQKVLTPATSVETTPETTGESCYTASVFADTCSVGLALGDLTTGDFRVCELTSSGMLERLSDELERRQVKELIRPETAGALDEILRPMSSVFQTAVQDVRFSPAAAAQELREHFGVSELDGLIPAEWPAARRAAGALLHYFRSLRRASLSHLRRLSCYDPSDRLVLDPGTLRNLELLRNSRDGTSAFTLLEVLDHTTTPMGARFLRSALTAPSRDLAAINERLDAVGELVENSAVRHKLRDGLRHVSDIERLVSRITLGVAFPRDLIQLGRSLEPAPECLRHVESLRAALFGALASGWDCCTDLADLIAKSILPSPAAVLKEGGIIRDGWNAELDELRALSRDSKSTIVAMEARERDRTGIGSLKIKFNKVFGYYIEVSKPNLRLVPPDYLRKQTLANAERFTTPELSEYEAKVLGAEEKICELEERLFVEVRERLSREAPRLQDLAARIAVVDFVMALAEQAVEGSYCRPALHAGSRLRLADSRHPVIERVTPTRFVPNDCEMDDATRQILIVTGPNMGGKSTYLRQVALCAVMAQMGSFVPAREAVLPVFDRVFTRVGASDNLAQGQSTFMVEMVETAQILNSATSSSLIILDEVGRGTGTFDGLSLAWAIVEQIHNQVSLRAKTLFATHYFELTELELQCPRVKNCHITVKEGKDRIVFLRKVKDGRADKSYGIHVAALAGLPKEVVERAREILGNLESNELDPLGKPRLARSRRAADGRQLVLFEPPAPPELAGLKQDIENIKIEELTPLEALNRLHEMKKRMQNAK
ncbi:MAG: DNA mismatch repair protein MutS [Acidobacteriota bacterium]